MKPQINMIGIITAQFTEMRNFYHQVLEFPIKLELESYVEFENEGVRLAISTTEVMAKATGQASYQEPKKGHSFELAFKADSPTHVDQDYQNLIAKGATPIKPPADQPWGQRTAFFADPDGNIHEIFADLS